MSTEDKVSSLVSMGFNATEAEGALNATGGNVEQSVEQLLASNEPAQHTAPSSPIIIAAAAAATSPPHQQQAPVTKVRYITFKQDRRGVLYWVLNILWILLGGWHMFVTWFLTGLALCLTCVLFPCGWQVMKISFFLLFPFGLTLYDLDDEIKDEDIRCCSKGCNCLLNILWALTVGWILALQQIITGILLCLTIIGIPFGWQCFKMSYLCFRPFGLGITAQDLQTIEIVTTDEEQGTNYRAMPQGNAQSANLIPVVL